MDIETNARELDEASNILEFFVTTHIKNSISYRHDETNTKNFNMGTFVAL
jgi:hypothetical protein